MDMSIPPRPVAFPETRASDRDLAIRARYLQGETLAGIGRAFGVSAERVRKIVKRFGLDKSNAGLAVRNGNRPSRPSKAPASVRTYGCSEADLVGVPIEQRQAFLQQRTNVRRTAGARWELALLEWAGIWARSGKWRERGQGPLKYGLSRIDASGPYSVGNVRIARNHDSAMRGRSLKSAERRKDAMRKHRNEKWIREMARILKKASTQANLQADPAETQ